MRVLDSDPLRAFVAYLQAPTRFAELAVVAAFMLLQQTGKRQPADRVAAAHEQWRTAETATDLPLLASEGNTATIQMGLGAHARLLLDVGGAMLASLLTEPSAATVTLRLDDEHAARSAPTFEHSWRLWLRAWNLLQVLLGAVLVTREAMTPGIPRPAVAPHVVEETGDPRLAVVREVADAEAARVLARLLERHPTLPAPAVPFELRQPVHIANGDVEVGWPTHKVAAYLDHQTALADALRGAGWTVFALERGISVEALELALGLGGK